MGKTIAISNQKGGVGKTTTAVNLSAALAEVGMKVLLIDIDPQGNASTCFGFDKQGDYNSIYELLLGECEVGEVLVSTDCENLDLIPSHVNLAGAEIELIGVDNKEFLLSEAIKSVRDNYDFILIDCPPALNTLSLNAMTTADSVMIPIQTEFLALEGLSQMIVSTHLIQERLNNKLEIEGVVFTMFDGRTNLSNQVVENVYENLTENIFKTVIPRNVRLSEAPSYGQTILKYDTRSTGANAYRSLADELLKKNGIEPKITKKKGLFGK